MNRDAIEAVAAQARAQLADTQRDALTLQRLAAISELDVNDLHYQLWISLDHPVTDEDGLPVLGLCEFDPDCGEDAVSVLISPVGERLSPELALSTLAHELGHAIFDAPAWLLAARRQRRGGASAYLGRRPALRTLTRHARHLGEEAESAAPDGTPAKRLAALVARLAQAASDKQRRIAEFRANEFMGSLLVPRQRLVALALERAPHFDVGIEAAGERSDAGPRLVQRGALGWAGMQRLQRDLAACFGVTPAFVRVRMQRYGLLPGEGPT
ncbi:hypothetical protein [Tepidimonas thermarum]|uniref:hypothetical protein n=1 Tax=Tepidimonas thermarum TaxID=335431 RepID=UPI00117F8DAB|nr:hypothetical protein [Tepidimonas thermarum]